MAPGPADDDLIGKVLNGRFRVVARIGAGGMGRVYKAVQEPIDRLVALKVLNPRYDGQKDPGFERRFFLEASMTAKLKHPNTITVHDYGRTDDGIYYIAMEYLEGETLQAVLRRGPILWSRALSIGSQIARSLREAHKQGMVHRDLKPANVMVLAEGTGGDVVKVLDFGLVKSFLAEKKKKKTSGDGEEEEDTDGEGSITQAGVLLGSPLYMAPEQARSDADGRTDIYALGTVLFQCIAGRTPFHGKESIDILVKQVRERPPELKVLQPSVPDEVHDLVMKCLEKSPDNRFQSMDELLEAMRAVLNDEGLGNAFADPRNTSGPDTSTLPSLVIIQPDPRKSVNTDLPFEIPPARSRQSEKLPPSPAPRRLGLAALGGAVVVVAGLVIFAFARPTKTVVVPMPTPAVVKQPKPSPVVFEVDSEPSGAAVARDGEPAGVTPFSFVMIRPPDGVASVELTFELEGYELATVVAQGTEESVPVRAVLKKVPAIEVQPEPTPGKKPPKPPPGYKADPYQ